MMAHSFALILAGGKGTRLWPLSRENYPKQFIEFKDGMSLFQLTIRRLLKHFDARHVFTITQESYRFTILNQLDLCPGLAAAQRSAVKANVFCEPTGRNTLPAIMLSFKHMEATAGMRDEDVLFVFPSDHVIEGDPAFSRSIAQAQALAATNRRIVVFGLKPTHPKEGYGYILTKRCQCMPAAPRHAAANNTQCHCEAASHATCRSPQSDRQQAAGGKASVRSNLKPISSRGPTQYLSVSRFIEKPTAVAAANLIKQGAFWNAGIFCLRKDVFLQELADFQPKLRAAYSKTYDSLLKAFPALEPESIDYGIMQKTACAALVPFNVRWTDLGSWDSFVQFSGLAGSDGNAVHGAGEFVESRNCFAFGKDRLITMIGMEDTIAVDSNDSLLILKKGSSDRVRDLVAAINKRGLSHTKDSATVYRPWGYYTVLHEVPGYKVKEIGVFPRRALSLQKHKQRSEHWNVVEGSVTVVVDGNTTVVNKNQSMFVPRGKKHRITNPTSKLAKVIEVQIGPYLGEDDIVRYTEY